MTFCLCLWEWLLKIHHRINWINPLILVNPTVISVRKVVEVQVEVFELALRVSWQGWTSRQRPIVVGALARKFAFWPLSTMWLDWSTLWRDRNFGQIWAAVGSRGSRRISKSPLWPEEQQHHCNSLSLFWGFLLEVKSAKPICLKKRGGGDLGNVLPKCLNENTPSLSLISWTARTTGAAQPWCAKLALLLTVLCEWGNLILTFWAHTCNYCNYPI